MIPAYIWPRDQMKLELFIVRENHRCGLEAYCHEVTDKAVQEEKGHVPDEAIEWVARRLELEPINIYEIVTFYPMLKRKPVGKKHVRVCRTLSCALRGGYQMCKTLQEQLGCKLEETSANGEFSIEFVECLASCGTAPVLMVNEEHHENMENNNPEQSFF